ncbi:MAG: polysaccharide deacetylase family protein [Dorea sp.]
MYEINKTDELIEAITGQRVQYIRPPFGVWQRELENYLDVLRCTCGRWTLWTWTAENIDEVVNKSRCTGGEGGNDIILLRMIVINHQ